MTTLSLVTSDLSARPMTQHTRTESSVFSGQSTRPGAEGLCARPSSATDCLGSPVSLLWSQLFINDWVGHIDKGKFHIHCDNVIYLEPLYFQPSNSNKNLRSFEAQAMSWQGGNAFCSSSASKLHFNCDIPALLWELPKPLFSHIGFSDLSQAVHKCSGNVSAFLGSSHWRHNISSAYRGCLINDQNADSFWKIF